MKVSEDPVVVEEEFDCSLLSVWEAITEVEQMRAWYFDNIPEFEAAVGFETQFLVVNEGREFPHLWRITEVVPMEKIAYEWRFGGYPGRGLVAFELSEDNGATRLQLTNRVLEDFPDEVPEFRRESCLEGWRYLLGESLRAYLEPG